MRGSSRNLAMRRFRTRGETFRTYQSRGKIRIERVVVDEADRYWVLVAKSGTPKEAEKIMFGYKTKRKGSR